MEGFYRTNKGLDQAISRGLAYAEYADLIWCETGTPDLEFAKDFADAIHAKFPGKLLAYNCSPSFNWKKNLDDATIAKFQKELGAMGYKFQFITLAGFHSLNYSMFDLAYGYARNNMSAFVELQQKEFAAADKGFTAVKHQREVGTGYFDAVTTTIEAQCVHRRAEGLDRGRAVLRREEGGLTPVPESPASRNQPAAGPRAFRLRTGPARVCLSRIPVMLHRLREAPTAESFAVGHEADRLPWTRTDQSGNGHERSYRRKDRCLRRQQAQPARCPECSGTGELRIDSENINENFEVENRP